MQHSSSLFHSHGLRVKGWIHTHKYGFEFMLIFFFVLSAFGSRFTAGIEESMNLFFSTSGGPYCKVMYIHKQEMSRKTVNSILWCNVVGHGGLGVTCSPRDPRLAGSNPAEVDGFFQNVKILSFNLGVPNLRFQAR